MDTLSPRCLPTIKCYDSIYSEKGTLYTQSFLEAAGAMEITEATLSWFEVARKGSRWELTLMGA
jgi:hypothetical protein